jgi:hypothetical protein
MGHCIKHRYDRFKGADVGVFTGDLGATQEVVCKLIHFA